MSKSKRQRIYKFAKRLVINKLKTGAQRSLMFIVNQKVCSHHTGLSKELINHN